jgi:putative lipoprotein
MINKLILSASIAVSTLFVGCTTPNNNHAIKPNVSLTNTYFKALSLNGAKAEVFEREAHIKFEEKGVMNGYLGCNGFFGSFKTQDKNISFENVGSTKMMCPNMKTEDAFANVLQNTKTYEIKGETLNFFDEKGQKISTFEAVYF